MDTVKIVMKELLEAGLIHGDCLTVTGKTVAENLKDVPKLSELDPQVKFCYIQDFNNNCVKNNHYYCREEMLYYLLFFK